MSLIILFLFYAFLGFSMWQKAATYSADSSTAMGTFVETSEWLSKTLKQDEIAVVPTASVFQALNPELRYKLVDYKSLWDSVGVKFHERFSKEKLRVVQKHFNDFIKENPRVTYVVRDWVDAYAKYLFEKNDELVSILREVKVMPFTLSTGWSNRITVYKHARYQTLFAIDLSSPPNQSYTYPANASVHFSSDGAIVEKEFRQVGFYLPFLLINASRQSYLLMNASFHVENLTLQVVFYYDENRDGIFSGYSSSDYVKSGVFSQAELGWVNGGTYTIYQSIPVAPDPVVQIGILLFGEGNGSIVIHDLTVYAETASSTQ